MIEVDLRFKPPVDTFEPLNFHVGIGIRTDREGLDAFGNIRYPASIHSLHIFRPLLYHLLSCFQAERQLVAEKHQSRGDVIPICPFRPLF